MSSQHSNPVFLLGMMALSTTIFACNSTPISVNTSPTESISTTDSSASTPIPAGDSKTHSNIPKSMPPTLPSEGEASQYPKCISSDSNHICIGLKIVSYKNAAGVPVITKADAVNLVEGMNRVWSQCNIAYQLEVYQAIDPTTVGLNYSPDWQVESDDVREKFKDAARFVIIAVGPWSVTTIAVTNMPGSGLYGTLVDNQYARNPLTVGHELGHYQGLYHVEDTTNLMNAYIEDSTSGLYSNQCETAVSTDKSEWQLMIRKPIL